MKFDVFLFISAENTILALSFIQLKYLFINVHVLEMYISPYYFPGSPGQRENIFHVEEVVGDNIKKE